MGLDRAVLLAFFAVPCLINISNGVMYFAFSRPLETVCAMDVAELINIVTVNTTLVVHTVNGISNICRDRDQETVQSEDHKTTIIR